MKTMPEKDWVASIIKKIEKLLRLSNDNIRVVDGHRLAYAYEVIDYDNNDKPQKHKSIGYETDILVYEQLDEENWKPRVVIEAKLSSINTHDAITYSQKAQAHKYVHPYLRYGILLGDRKQFPLPGRLFRHGEHFDFMISWKSFRANSKEIKKFIEIVNDEIQASKTLDEILFNSRLRNRDKFTSLHRPLKLCK